jgi:hypothetical protein
MKKIVFVIIGLLCLSICQMVTLQAKAGLPPVAYWKLDEGSGTTAYDSSGNGNTGTLNNGPQWVDGVVGKALKFDGVDDYVYVPHSSSLDITGDQMTVEYWMKLSIDWHPGMSTHDMNIFDKGNAYVGAMIAGTGTHRFNLPFKPPPTPETNKNSWTANVWYHMADVYDGTYIKLYVNGVLDNSEPVAGPISHSTYNFAIGAQCIQAWPWYFSGTIDEFAIYEYTRTPEEIWNDYTTNAPYHELTVTSTPITGIPFIINSAAKTTPYGEWLPEGYYNLEMPQTYSGYNWSKWLEDGDTNRIKTIYLHGTLRISMKLKFYKRNRVMRGNSSVSGCVEKCVYVKSPLLPQLHA